MKYTLMHKNISVADLVLDETTGSIVKIENLYEISHLPVGVSVKKQIVDRAALNEWWLDRSIPASRSGVRKALETLNIYSTKMLLTRCYGLSLSDQYWIKPRGQELKWENVNFFDNDFSEDIGDVLLGKATDKNNFDFHSPDNTSDGCLKKRWKIIDGKRCLLKAGSTPFMQQPFNEVIASIIMDRLNIPHVPYTLLFDDKGNPYSVCEDFIDKDTELVSAWKVMTITKRDNNTSVYRHYINCCKELGIDNIEHAIDQMIVLDYIITNEDRHQNNFGLVRNANTLEWLKVAPIFDSGTSLGYDKLTNKILTGENVECKPFKKSHDEQLKLVTSFEWIDFKALKGLEDDIRAVFSNAQEYIDEARVNMIIRSINKKIEVLQGLALSAVMSEDNIENDVDEDIAEDYTFIPKM